MLLQLEIHNVALIDKINVELGRGLNILTGETGAGKSIIIDSINAILGNRLSRDLIRTGEEKALVEAVFQVRNKKLEYILSQQGVDAEEDGTIIISREFSTTGRNICRVNGKLATVSTLKEIGAFLVDVHGQHDNQSLLRPESHIELLDAFGGEDIQKIKNEYADVLTDYKKDRNILREISGKSGDREKKIDLLKYQINEIISAKLTIGEEEELNSLKTLLTNSEKIVFALSSAYELLFTDSTNRSSANDSINEALSRVGDIGKYSERYLDIYNRLESLSYQLYDIVEEVRNSRDTIDFDTNLLDQTEERLDLIYKLKRKYGHSIAEILESCSKMEKELEGIINDEDTIKNLNKKLSATKKKLLELAEHISKKRKEAACLLESQIGQELQDLEMKGCRFKVSIEKENISDDNEIKFLPDGLDKVEFLISPNIGEGLKPLSRIASGGEMSRVMLAIKTILANVDDMPTLIFDEIDAGISGKASQKVGEKLRLISKNHQVICVTHLAQIACMADTHFLIEKIAHDGSTYTKINKLDNEDRKNEIARIIGGANISEITLKHAEEMLGFANKAK